MPGVDRRTVWRKENIVCVFQRGSAVLMVMVMVMVMVRLQQIMFIGGICV